jgi:hypothetical protein
MRFDCPLSGALLVFFLYGLPHCRMPFLRQNFPLQLCYLHYLFLATDQISTFVSNSTLFAAAICYRNRRQ